MSSNLVVLKKIQKKLNFKFLTRCVAADFVPNGMVLNLINVKGF
jgi:hypothetical protein